MANELNISYPGVLTPYVVLRRTSDAYVWNGSTFVTYNASDWTTYVITLSNDGGNFYAASMPSGVASGTRLFVQFRERAGGSAATSDIVLNSRYVTWDGSGLVSPSVATSGYPTVATLRLIARQGGMQVDAATYTDTQVDYGLQYAGNDFVNHCRALTLTSGTAALSGTLRTVDLSGITNFFPENVSRIEVTDYTGIVTELDLVDWATMTRTIAAQGTAGGTAIPTAIAFNAGTVATVDYAPGTMASRIEVWHHAPFTYWTPGDAASGTATVNIPIRHAYPVAHDGASAVIQLSDPNARSQSEGWQRYLAHRAFTQGRIGPERGIAIANPNFYL